jgi:hypothetical protein
MKYFKSNYLYLLVRDIFHLSLIIWWICNWINKFSVWGSSHSSIFILYCPIQKSIQNPMVKLTSKSEKFYNRSVHGIYCRHYICCSRKWIRLAESELASRLWIGYLHSQKVLFILWNVLKISLYYNPCDRTWKGGIFTISPNMLDEPGP